MKKYALVCFGLLIFLPLFAFASFDQNLKYGSSGTAVSELQDFLIAQNCLTGNTTGNFFSLTLQAVKCFQSKNNLPVTGYFGPMTRTVANSLLTQEVAPSNTQEVTETGTTTTPDNTKNDAITALQNQINALLAQLQILNDQVKAQTNVQQQTQQGVQQIQQNTMPPIAVVPAPTPTPVTTTNGTTTLLISFGQSTPTTNSVYLSWSTNIPTNSKVFLTQTGSSLNSTQIIPSASGYSTQHSVNISSLTPNTQYSYTIEATNAVQDQKLNGVINTNTLPSSTITSTTSPASTQPQSILSVSVPSGGVQVTALGNNISLGEVQLSAVGSSRDIDLSTVPLDLTVGGSGSVAELSNCRLFNGTAPLNSGMNVVSPIGGSNTFVLDQPLTVPKGTTVALDVTCNIAGNTVDGSTFAWGVSSNDSWSLTDKTNGSVVNKNIISGTGQVVTINVPGSMTMSVDPSTPSYSFTLGGTSGVIMGIIKFHATSESVNLAQLGLAFTSGVSADVTKLYLYNGSTLLGSVSLSGGATTAISLATPFTLSVNTDTQLTIKADIANIGVGQSGTEGDLVKIDPTNAQGFGVYTGSAISANASAGVSGVRIFKTYPSVSLDPLPPSTGSTNNVPLIRFHVMASSAGAVSINNLNLAISPSSGMTFSHVNVVVYNNASYQPLPDGYGNSTGVVDISGPMQASGIISYLESKQIPAGATYYFQLQGNFSSSPTGFGSITTTLQGDSSFSGMNTPSGVSGNFVWSPNTNGVSRTSDSDWTNGYAIPGLPSSGISQTRTY